MLLHQIFFGGEMMDGIAYGLIEGSCDDLLAVTAGDGVVQFLDEAEEALMLMVKLGDANTVVWIPGEGFVHQGSVEGGGRWGKEYFDCRSKKSDCRSVRSGAARHIRARA